MPTADSLATLITGIGTPGFGGAVMDAFAAHAGASMCSAFALRGRAPEVILAQSADASHSPFARIASLRYADHYWRRDTDTLYNLGRAHRTVLTARRSARAIRDIDYRLECYADGAVGERISICRAGPVGIIVNAYRTKESGYFATAQTDWIESAAPILIAAVAKHCEVLRASDLHRATVPDRLTEYLCTRPGVGLSLRERQVLAEAASGASQAETAARLGIALTSVATYRRRACAKLGVQNQRQLRALMSPHPTHFADAVAHLKDRG